MLADEWWSRIVEEGMGEAYVFDALSCRFKLVNRQARQNLGYDAAELSELTPWHIKPLINEQQFRQIIAPLISGEVPLLAFETEHQRKDGTRYEVSVRLQMLRSAEKAVFFAAIEDVTERRRASRSLLEVTDRLNAILENTRMALFMMDRQQKCIFMNAAGEAMTGFTSAEIMGQVLHDMIHHTHPDGTHFPLQDCAIDRAFPENSQQSGETFFVHKDGRFFPVGFTASPMRDASGLPIGTIIEARVIAEEMRAREQLLTYHARLESEIADAIAKRKLAEDRLFQAQKMEAIGNLTGGVAHDFNNILQVIKGNLDLLAQDVAGQDPAARRLAHITTGVDRGAKLTSQLLAFGRRQPLAPRALNLGQLLHDMEDMLRRLLGEAVDVEVIAEDDVWNCSLDRVQMENAILNLAINGRDAMQGRGKLTLEVGNATLDGDYPAQHAEVAAGQYVMIAVTDTGCGMSPETMAMVFEPFFSTKPEGEGTGLGLSMVYGFVKQSGGHVKLYSEPEHGTTVRLYLPRTFQEVDELIEQPVAVTRGGTEKILVVEDDQAVRETVVEMLTGLGYHVLEAANADDARVIVESGVAIDLLFTDVVMPGNLRSTDLAHMTLAVHPGAGILFASGYTQNAIVHAGRLDEGVELLSKPYNRDSLARKVRHVLENCRSVPNQVGQGLQVRKTDPLRILAVEDEPLILMNLVEILTGMGHQVTDVSDVAAAKLQLETSQYDILLTDVGLPDGSGIELASWALSRMPNLHIIMATGRRRDADTWPASCIMLPKPYDEIALKNAIAAASTG